MDDEPIKFFGYQFSVYTRSIVLCLIEKGIAFDYFEIDPFQPVTPSDLANLNPFGRVPILLHDGNKIYETSAIARYLDARFPQPSLTPIEPIAVARMQQVIGIMDSYGYKALVQQVFANAVFRPLEGERPDADQIQTGLRESRRALFALDEIAREGKVLGGFDISLADFHLLPMIDYFLMVEEGAELLGQCPAIAKWWCHIAKRGSTIQTRPDLTKVVQSS